MKIRWFKNENNPRVKSVVRKWWLIISTSIFLLLSFFTWFIMHLNLVSQQQMLVQETQKVASNIVALLSQESTELTSASVREILSQSGEFIELDNHIFSRPLTSSLAIDTDSNIQLYNAEKELVFATQRWNIRPILKSELSLQTDVQNNVLTIQVTDGVFSQETQRLIGYINITHKSALYNESLLVAMKSLSILVIVMLVVSIGVGYIVVSRMFLPIKNIQTIISSITDENIMTHRLSVPKQNDEVAIITTYVNELLDRIAFYVDQQTQFVEDVSHELRTPVAIVEGHLKLLNRWGKDDPVVLEESLQSSLNEIGRMKTLVQEMLDLSRATQVPEYYRDATVNVYELTKHTVENFRLLYPEFHFRLDKDLTKEQVVQMYSNHFEQVIIILLDNAVKYSLNRKEIIITVSVTEPHVEIAVQDFGMGMSESDVKKVFARFYRVDKARSRERGGNGLGLSIAKQLLSNYKGEIDVTSVMNVGSVFKIKLPIVSEGEVIS